jgi:hypothetical protein
MGNFTFGYTLVDYTPTASSEDSNYPIANIKDYAHLKRHFRSQVATEVTIVLDFVSAKVVQVMLLDDVNFADVYIQGNATNVWDTPSFSQQYTISKDAETQRYRLCEILTGFNYQYMRIKIPAQTPVDGLSVFRIGRIACMTSKIEFTDNPSFPYRHSASYPEPLEVKFPSGGDEQVEQGDYKIWQGEFGFDRLEKTNEPQLWLLDSLKPTDYLIFYENLGDASRGFFCKKKSQLEVEWGKPKTIKTNTYILREVI